MIANVNLDVKGLIYLHWRQLTAIPIKKVQYISLVQWLPCRKSASFDEKRGATWCTVHLLRSEIEWFHIFKPKLKINVLPWKLPLFYSGNIGKINSSKLDYFHQVINKGKNTLVCFFNKVGHLIICLQSTFFI